mmetsp:Transcript_8020/g.13078  ORF Transcript_8020/g.13078 Transcript_8020/m.13078 type:complete len:412 (-) Transcript_8020:253-1488(-)
MTCTIDNTQNCAFDDDYALSVSLKMQHCKLNSGTCAPSRSSWEAAHIPLASCSAAMSLPGLQIPSKDMKDYADDRSTEVGDASPRAILSDCEDPFEMGNPYRRVCWADMEDSSNADPVPARWADYEDSEEEQKHEVEPCMGEEEKVETGVDEMVSRRPSRASRRARRAAAQTAERADAGWNMESSDSWKSDSQGRRGWKTESWESWKNDSQTWQDDERDSSHTSKKETKAVGKGKSAGKGVVRPNEDAQGYGKASKGGSKGKNGGKGKSKGDGKGKGYSDKGAGKGVGGEKFQCQVYVGIEEDQKFRVVRRMIGSGGEHMKSIADESGAKLRLRGRGSKFLEGPEQQESEDDLMLCVSAQDQEGFEKAKKAACALIERIHDHYRAYCKKVGITCPTLRVYIHEGYRAGSRK